MQTDGKASWLLLTLRASRSATPRLIAELWEKGTLGVETVDESKGEISLNAYFPATTAAPEVRDSGGRLWRNLGAIGVELIPVFERDWLAEYRRSATPFAVSDSIRVDPREPEEEVEPDSEGRHLLRLPARQAFGLGNHDTTRLMVERMELLDFSGKRVLDVGTGTGILCFAARLFGAGAVVGVERDPIAAVQARENIRLNGLKFGLVAGTLQCLAAMPRFDIALVNVLPERIAADLDRLRMLLIPRGAAIFSGILVDQAGKVTERLIRCGFELVNRSERGEWCALEMERSDRWRHS